MAISAAEYLLDELYWTEGPSIAGFSYPVPSSRAQVHNANLLGAALLCRVSKHAQRERFLQPALNVARYSAMRQGEDGRWNYGELPHLRWVDNFHTGYNLGALRSISQDAETSEFDGHIRRGFDFYRQHFLMQDGAAAYFYDQRYPIDIHSVAQSIITLMMFRDLDHTNLNRAHTVYRWAMEHLWNEQGYFYYRSLRLYTNKISYVRWSQAWMLVALSTLLEQSDADQVFAKDPQ
jgi:hypothetical protein